MLRRFSFFLLFSAFEICNIDCQSYKQPEQIHISYPNDPRKMWITWITFESTNKSVVEYGEGTLQHQAYGSETRFTDGGPQKRKLYIHRVLLENLKPKQTYIYKVGSPFGWSSVFYFTAIQTGTHWSPRFAVYGDLGNVNGQSFGRLQNEAQSGRYDMYLHVGDMAYDLDTNNAQYGDQFLRQLEPIAAIVPYMVVVGNHESAYNFSNFVNRFTMPGNTSNFYYSFDVGPVHFVSLSTEFYYYLNYGWTQLVNQYAWLEADLKKASANREKIPWIITMGHRPMYCSNWDTADCTKFESRVRSGLPYVHAYGLEDLFYKYGVDLEIWAHEHSYERMFPVYNRTVYKGASNPYTDPCAPVHIISGAAGCQERTRRFVPNPNPWSAFRSSDYGYARMTVHNSSHLYLEQVSDDKGGKVIDKVWLVKNHHGPYDPKQCKHKGVHFAADEMNPEKWAGKPCKKCDSL